MNRKTRVILSGALRVKAGDGSIELLNVDSVGLALKKLVDKSPQLTPMIYNENGEIKVLLNIFVNKENIRYLQGQETLLADGDELTLLMPVGGG